MSFKPTATVGPTLSSGSMSIVDKSVAYQSLGFDEKTMALQQYANKLRNEKFLAKKRLMQMNDDRSNNFVTSSPVRFVTASKSLSDASPSSYSRLNADAPAFVPPVYALSTPPTTPSFDSEKSPKERPTLNGMDLLANQKLEKFRAVKNRSLSVNDVDESEKNTTKELDTSNGCNSSKRVFYSSNGSSITTPESIRSDFGDSNDGRIDFQSSPYDCRPVDIRPKLLQINSSTSLPFLYDRETMLLIKSNFEAKNAFSLFRSKLSDEFLNNDGVWSPDLWIKSEWKKEAEMAGAETEDDYFRARIPSKTAWFNNANPGYIRRSVSLR